MDRRLVEHVLVRLVGDDPEVVPAGEVHDRLERLAAEDRAGGVVRRVDEDGASRRRDRPRDRLGLVLEARLLAHRDRHDRAAGEADVLGHLGPHRVGDDHLVAWAEQRAEDDVQGVHRAVGEEDILGLDGLDAVLLAHLAGERAAQLGDAVIGDVVRLAVVRGRGDGVEHVRRDGEARVARLEADDAGAAGLGAQQRLANLHDLAERDAVHPVRGQGIHHRRRHTLSVSCY